MLTTLFLSVAVTNFSPAFSTSADVYESKNSDDYVSCERGWYYFRDKCYRVAARRLPERFTWTNALSLCKGYGADLVSIQSQEEQDFIVAYLQLDVKWWAWTGLNDRVKEGDWRWSDGSAFNFSDWKAGEPSGKGLDGDDEDCVHIVYEPERDIVGKWNDRHCETPEYVLCEMKANPRKRSPNLIYCSPEDGGGWKYENSCFHIVTEKLSWQNAERHCKNRYKGNLLTIRDTLQDYFLELALPDIKKEIWIGIKIQDQLQQKWTSGWYVSYERFDEEEKYVQGTCVARKSRKEWITIPCTEELPFICEVSKASPPILKPPPLAAHCPTELDDWRDLGGDYCYYIETTKRANFYEANFDCQRRGGHMLSLHSQEESDILKPFVEHKMKFFFIGLIRLLENSEEFFGWTDGSELSYQNWNHREPNSFDEKCVELETRTMKWNDLNCGNKLHGYICSVKKIVPNGRTSSLVGESNNCESFCVAPTTYLYGVIIQCPEAKRLSQTTD